MSSADVGAIIEKVCAEMSVAPPTISWLPAGTDDAYYDGATVYVAPDAHPEWVLHELAHHCQQRPADGHGPGFSKALTAVRGAWLKGRRG